MSGLKIGIMLNVGGGGGGTTPTFQDVLNAGNTILAGPTVDFTMGGLGQTNFFNYQGMAVSDASITNVPNSDYGAAQMVLEDNLINTNTLTRFGFTIRIPANNQSNVQSATDIKLLNAGIGSVEMTSQDISIANLTATNVLLKILFNGLTFTNVGTGNATALTYINPTGARSITIPDDSGKIMINHSGRALNQAVVGSQVTFAHGLTGANSAVFVSALDANMANATLLGYTVSVSLTNIVINFLSPPLAATVSFNWLITKA